MIVNMKELKTKDPISAYICDHIGHKEVNSAMYTLLSFYDEVLSLTYLLKEEGLMHLRFQWWCDYLCSVSFNNSPVYAPLLQDIVALKKKYDFSQEDFFSFFQYLKEPLWSSSRPFISEEMWRTYLRETSGIVFYFFGKVLVKNLLDDPHSIQSLRDPCLEQDEKKFLKEVGGLWGRYKLLKNSCFIFEQRQKLMLPEDFLQKEQTVHHFLYEDRFFLQQYSGDLLLQVEALLQDFSNRRYSRNLKHLLIYLLCMRKMFEKTSRSSLTLYDFSRCRSRVGFWNIIRLYYFMG